MKAARLKFTAICAVLLTFLVSSADAQSIIGDRQTFVVPFEFYVGQEVLPAGEYTVKSEKQTIMVQSKDGREVVTVLPLRTRFQPQAKIEAKLAFKRNGDEHYLSQVWLADGITRELRRTPPADSDLVRNWATVVIAVTPQQ